MNELLYQAPLYIDGVPTRIDPAVVLSDEIDGTYYGFYTLDKDKRPVRCSAREFESGRRLTLPVKQVSFKVWTYRKPKKGGYKTPPKRISVFVSTVFLGLDHGFDKNRPPLIFESMCFFNRESSKKWSQRKEFSPLEQYQKRYYTYQEAAIGHDALCKMVANFHRKT